MIRWIRALFGLLLVFSQPAHAWEFWTGSLADVTIGFQSKALTGGFLGDRNGISPTVGYPMSDRFEVLVAPSFNFHTAGNYIARIMTGASVDFLDGDLGGPYFIKGLLGFDDILDNRTSDYINFNLKTFIWTAAVGRRFELTPGWAFSPEVSFTMIFESYSAINSLSIVPLQFSLFY